MGVEREFERGRGEGRKVVAGWGERRGRKPRERLVIEVKGWEGLGGERRGGEGWDGEGRGGMGREGVRWVGKTGQGRLESTSGSGF